MAKKKKAAKKKAGKKEVLVVASKVKAFNKSRGVMTSSDAIAALNEKVYNLLTEGAKRTKANRRRTLKPQDL